MPVVSPISIRRDGFPNERHLIVPGNVLENLATSPPPVGIWPGSAGYFPNAAGHFVTRPKGDAADILLFCMHGEGWCRFSGKNWRVQSSQAIIVPHGIAHSYGTTKRHPWSIYWAHLLGPARERWLVEAKLAASDRVVGCMQPGVLRYHFEALLDLLAAGFSPAHLLATSAALGLLLGHFGLHREIRHSTAQDNREAVRQTAEFMRQNLSRNVTIQELARLSNLSPPRYTVVFRDLFGFPPLAWFLQIKIQAACRMLAEESTPVQEIAETLGFGDPYYFSRFFKKIMGTAPLHYRQANRLR